MLSDKIKHALNWVQLSHTPTPLERMNNLSSELALPDGEINLMIKRDDCTGLAMGGNKARQLEFYLGEALAQNADTVLTTGAIQSNHVRMTVAAAHKLGLTCEVQLEQRVPDRPPEYYQSGNPFLIRMMGATIHQYPVGEDEEGADRALYQRAEELECRGKTPYVIPLAPGHKPLGALGYVLAAEELLAQMGDKPLDAVVLGSGSGTTHAGMLTGLRALGCNARVYGICVRRAADLQRQRLAIRCQEVAEMIGHENSMTNSDIIVDDAVLAPGYGQLNTDTERAISLAGRHEGILLDPTYTGKAFAGLLRLAEQQAFKPGSNVVFLHTGGVPGVFGYPELVAD